jgi:hypothetical protein
MSTEPRYIQQLRTLANTKTTALNEALAYIDELRRRAQEAEKRARYPYDENGRFVP